MRAQIAIMQSAFNLPHGLGWFDIIQPFFAGKPAKPFCLEDPDLHLPLPIFIL
jgi:hypothetical protein